MEIFKSTTLPANYGVIAYHFLQHNFRVSRKAQFYKMELQHFVESLKEYATMLGYDFVDKENNFLKVDDIANEILFQYAEEIPDNVGNLEFYFPETSVAMMREEYEKKSLDDKKLIFGFESTLARNNYSVKDIYSMVEKGYCNSIKKIEKTNINKDFSA